MEIRKPKAVADDPYKSAKWDELTAGRSLGRSDAPALALCAAALASFAIGRAVHDLPRAGARVLTVLESETLWSDARLRCGA